MTITSTDADTGLCLEKQSELYDLSNPEGKEESTKRLEAFYEDLQIVLNPHICLEVGEGSGDNALRLHEKLPDTQIVAFEEKNPFVYENWTYKGRIPADKDPQLQYIKRILEQGEGAVTKFVCRMNHDGSYAIDEKTDVDPNDLGRVKLDTFKFLRTYSLNQWKRKLAKKNFSLRVNTQKSFYTILKGLDVTLFGAQTLFLGIPAKPQQKGDWTPEDIIALMLKGGFKPLTRDFPDTDKYFRMIFIKEKYMEDKAVIKQYKKFLNRANEPDTESKKATETLGLYKEIEKPSLRDKINAYLNK